MAHLMSSPLTEIVFTVRSTWHIKARKCRLSRFTNTTTAYLQDLTHLMSSPLTEAAAVSAMYAGAACIAKPMPNPYVTLPVSSRG